MCEKSSIVFKMDHKLNEDIETLKDRTSHLESKLEIDISVIEECIQKRNIRYDKDGDNHYDVISAFIKSLFIKSHTGPKPLAA